MTSKQKQRGRHLRRWLYGVLVFVVVASAQAQPATNSTPANTSTNQPAPQGAATNAEPEEPVVLPAYVPPSPEDLNGQNVPTNPPGLTPVPPAQVGPAVVGARQPLAPIMGTSALTGVPGAVVQGPPGPGIPIWGPFDIHPHLFYSFLYGNGLEAVPGQSSITTINTIAPGFLLDIGPHWSIDYSPSLSFYSNPVFKNTTDESATLRGNWARDDWVFSLSQSYVQTTEPLIETGTQPEVTAYATAFNASYQMGSKMSLQLGVDQNFRDTAGEGELSDLEEWLTQDWLNYQAGDMFGMGIGAVLGYDNVSPGSAMPFEQGLGRITFNPGPKLSVTISGGYEDRQFIDPSEPPLISPIFTGELAYSNQFTTISLGASRTVIPSLLQNEVETVTSYHATIKQTLSRKFSLQGNAGYTEIPFTSIVPEPLPQYYVGTPPVSALAQINNDEITSLSISLSYAIVPDCATLSVLYTWRNDSSGQAAFSYISRQVGFTFNYTY